MIGEAKIHLPISVFTATGLLPQEKLQCSAFAQKDRGSCSLWLILLMDSSRADGNDIYHGYVNSSCSGPLLSLRIVDADINSHNSEAKLAYLTNSALPTRQLWQRPLLHYLR